MNPPEKKRLPASPEEWLVHAKSDLKLARLGKESKDVLPQQICFHAQQAVEKAFKAVLLLGSKFHFRLGYTNLEPLKMRKFGKGNGGSKVELQKEIVNNRRNLLLTIRAS